MIYYNPIKLLTNANLQYSYENLLANKYEMFSRLQELSMEQQYMESLVIMEINTMGLSKLDINNEIIPNLTDQNDSSTDDIDKLNLSQIEYQVNSDDEYDQ